MKSTWVMMGAQGYTKKGRTMDVDRPFSTSSKTEIY
jgi:hypothetical protein